MVAGVTEDECKLLDNRINHTAVMENNLRSDTGICGVEISRCGTVGTSLETYVKKAGALQYIGRWDYSGRKYWTISTFTIPTNFRTGDIHIVFVAIFNTSTDVKMGVAIDNIRLVSCEGNTEGKLQLLQ